MFKKRGIDHRTIGISKRGVSDSVRKEAGHNNSFDNADTDSFSVKHRLKGIFGSVVHNKNRKRGHDAFSYVNSDGVLVELKDNEIRNIEKDIPVLCLQLCLLINSGLSVNNAIGRINQYTVKNTELNSLLEYVCSQAIQNNRMIENELYLISKRIKSKELMRVSLLLISNNITGSELNYKLENEYEILQSSKLSSARSKMKEADTKLCFPLMLLLISILLICITPALMQM